MPELGTRLLLLAALALWGCTGARPGPLPGGSRAAEEFDPQSLQEELLLIQPVFPPPALAADAGSAPGDSASPAAPVYRVQIMALTNEATARSSAAELGRILGVPVYVVAERGFFLVRAGRYSGPAGAEVLRRRVVALSPNYADAYVVPRPRRVAPGADGAGGQTPPTDAAGSAPVTGLVSGWRVVVDQFRTQEEAEKLRQEARERLGRVDIDLGFQPPWYRVEVGFCRTESEAQALVEDLQACGYRSALKVRAQGPLPQEAR